MRQVISAGTVQGCSHSIPGTLEQGMAEQPPSCCNYRNCILEFWYWDRILELYIGIWLKCCRSGTKFLHHLFAVVLLALKERGLTEGWSHDPGFYQEHPSEMKPCCSE